MTDESRAVSVAQFLDAIFIQESSSTALRRLGSCLYAIGVRPSEDDSFKFSDRNIRKNQVVSRLFEFWKARVPVTSVPGFIRRVYPESTEDRILSYRRVWSMAALEDLEPFEARE